MLEQLLLTFLNTQWVNNQICARGELRLSFLFDKWGFIGEKLLKQKRSLLKKLRKTFNQLRGKISRKLSCLAHQTRHNVFLPCRKTVICYSKTQPNCYQKGYIRWQQTTRFPHIVRKTIAMGVAEFQRVVCAGFSGVFAGFTATR